MAKEKESGFKKVRKGFFNVRAWADFDRHAETVESLGELLKRLFIPKRAKRPEDMDTAVKRLHIGDVDLEQRMQNFRRWALAMLVFSLLLFSYAMYHMFTDHWQAAMISVVFSLLSLAFAFRYHFWYFQIKRRKLGCSFKEWFKYSFLGDRS